MRRALRRLTVGTAATSIALLLLPQPSQKEALTSTSVTMVVVRTSRSR